MTETTETDNGAQARKKRFAPSTQDIEYLIDAHCRRDERLFSQRVKMLAERAGGSTAERWLRRVSSFTALELLPHDTRGLVVPLREVAFADLVLKADVERSLRALVKEWRARVHLIGRGLRPRRVVLFDGPPGNGKTSAAAAIAADLGQQAYVVSIANVVDAHMGATGAALDKVLGVVRAGHIVVFDEIDAIAAQRATSSSGADKENNRITNTLNTLLDQDFDGLIVATTNQPDLLDTALLRRLDLRVTFPGPEPEQLRALYDKLVQRYGLEKHRHSMPLDAASFDAATKHVLDLARSEALADYDREQHA